MCNVSDFRSANGIVSPLLNRKKAKLIELTLISVNLPLKGHQTFLRTPTTKIALKNLPQIYIRCMYNNRRNGMCSASNEPLPQLINTQARIDRIVLSNRVSKVGV